MYHDTCIRREITRVGALMTGPATDHRKNILTQAGIQTWIQILSKSKWRNPFKVQNMEKFTRSFYALQAALNHLIVLMYSKLL